MLSGSDDNNTFIFKNNWGNDIVIGNGGSDTLDFTAVTTAVTAVTDSNVTTVKTTGTDGKVHTLTAFGSFKKIKLPKNGTFYKALGVFKKVVGVGNLEADLPDTVGNDEPQELTEEQLNALIDEVIERWNDGSELPSLSPISLDEVN